MLTFRRSTFTGAARLLRPFIRLSAKTPDLALPDFFLFLNYLETGEMSSFSLEDISSFISLLLKKGLVEEVLRYLKRLRGLHESSLRNTIIYNIVILLAQNTNKSTQMKDAVLEVLKEADIKKILKNP